MTANQYRHARDTLGWSHAYLAGILGKSERASYRYAAGDVEIPNAVGKLIRHLVRDRLTMSARKFEALVKEL